ncbi:GEVED domain-containing protein, partial [uncultured Flavobacterium sp.]|uniref:GEVED domain-containing protein n=1 Tax=uncultured Flavobacterium sp. TaxID=165435 RepID=UPI0030EE6E3D
NTFGNGATAFTTGNIGGTIVSRYGGNGGNAGNNFSGGGGSSAGNVTGNNATGINGGAAPANGYAGANGRNSNGVGATGDIGAGGAGGRTAETNNRSGGSGGDGQIRITYTNTLATYCTQSFSTVEPITNVTYAGINNNTSNTINGTSSLESFCFSASVQQGGTNTISLKGNTNGNYQNNFRVYIDWDQNGVFGNNTNEIYDIGTITNSTGVDATTLTGNITVPITATLGNTRMRVIKNYNSYTGPCSTDTWGQSEDYIVNVTAPPVCVAPTTQPTALILTPATNTITGSFTAATPAPNNYLVVANTSGIAPSPTNGTNYTIGSTTLGGTNIVVDIDGNTTFSATSLSPSTTYYFFIYSYNSLCTGGPIYRTTSPLTGNATTSSVTYCTPTTSSQPQYLYINKVNFLGSLNDTSNTSTYNSTNPKGYQDFTGLSNKAIQAQGEGINISASASGTVVQRGRWKAWVDWNKNGVFDVSTEEIYTTQNIVSSEVTFGFVIPTTAVPGDYRLRIRINNGVSYNGSFYENYGYNFSPCDDFGYGSNNLIYFGEAEDYLFTVIANCDANIASVTDGFNCGSGQVTLNVNGTASSTSYKWYASENATNPIATTTNGSWTTPFLTTTTTYWVTATNPSCESVSKTAITAFVNSSPTITFTPNNPVICGENTIISLKAGGDKETVYLIDENFEAGNLGTFTHSTINSNGTTIDNRTQWTNRTSTFVPNEQIWYPAISSGFGTNKFVMTTSDVGSYTTENQIASATVNSTDFTNLTLKLKFYYSRYFPDNTYPDNDYVSIEISTNGGSSWSSTPIEKFISDQGIGTRFTELNYDLSSYINQPNLKIRVRYHADWCQGVAIDDVELFGDKPLNTSFNYNTAVVDAYIDAVCTIPYTVGSPIAEIYIKPTVTQLENASFNIPVTTTLSNGCTVNGSVTVTNNTKLFTPSASNSDWNTAANWKPAGVPTASNCIVIYENTTMSNIAVVGKGLNLIIKPGKTLNIAADNSLVITDFVKVENTGTLQIENNANLVQINDVANEGNIIYKRTAANIKGSDYVYWSSPVANQTLNNIYTSPTQGFKYSWNTLLNNGNGNGGNISQGNWVNADGNTMGTGIGYIVRGSSSYGMSATNINSSFTGVPNNGVIPVTVNRGTYTGITGYTGTNGTAINRFDDNYNLIGNPYPSSINALQFITDNSAIIEGNVRLWTHGTSPNLNNGGTVTNPFYGSYTYNYSASDYVTINYTGTTIPTAASIIKAGQAFFVVMKDGATGSGSVNFNNGQRRDTNGVPYANDNFFKTSSQQNTSIEELERHRIWLDIKDINNTTETTLVGYVEGASMGSDSTYDALANPLDLGIYSFINNESFIIQGRSLPFDDNDQVAIGFNVPTAGTYKIAINTADGLFLGTQEIYLKDEELNIYHNLKTNPYSFNATAGAHENRFKLVYKTASVLNNETFNQNDIQIAKNKNIVDIVSGNETMENVKIFDIRGRLIVEKSNINSNSISIDMNNVQDQVLIVKIVTTEGIKVTKKIL